MKRCSPEQGHRMSQVYCCHSSCGAVVVYCHLSHRPNGRRGVGVMGGCEDTRGKNSPSEDEQCSKWLHQKRALPWEHARCVR